LRSSFALGKNAGQAIATKQSFEGKFFPLHMRKKTTTERPVAIIMGHDSQLQEMTPKEATKEHKVLAGLYESRL